MSPWTTCPAPFPTSTRSSISSFATIASPKCTRCRASCSSRGALIRQLLRYLAEHGYYGDGDVDALVAKRVESLRNPSGKSFEDRTPDGRDLPDRPPQGRLAAAR